METRQTALRAQAGYYAVTGLWPLLHYDSFERSTGRKSERWLVETVGGLAATIGLALALTSRATARQPEGDVLSVGGALTFGAIDVIYLLRGRLAPVYAVDAAAQAGFLALTALSHAHADRG